MPSLKSLKILGTLFCLIIFASNVRVMSHWSEARGVYDDICYLQQAHLFQRFGLKGIDTDLKSDGDHWVSNKLKQINFPTWQNPLSAPCHTEIEATHKRVLQYPPGTGFVLAAFPEGFQVVPMYVVAMTLVLLCALVAIWRAAAPGRVAAASVFGCLAVYFMVNPAKASYSIAPTMAVCAIAGILTASLFQVRAPGQRLVLTALLGLVLGLSVNFRIANLFLLTGYCLFFLIAFIVARRREQFLQGALFGAACLVGMAPTLWANTVNAGGPLSTTYGPGDAVPMDFTFSIVPQYFRDLQGPLLILTIAWTAAIILADRDRDYVRLAALVALNLGLGVLYFMTHPIFTPYYVIPLLMLSLWSLLFGDVMREERVAPVRLSQ
jgi:hypothetical protein